MPFDPILSDAQTVTTPPERLRELASHRLIGIRIEVAQNPSTPNDVLRSLGANKSPRIRYAVATNTSISDSEVVQLAQDDDSGVRIAAAGNAVGRDRVIVALASSSDTAVRATIASLNKAAPLTKGLQRQLAGDSDKDTRQFIASSTNHAEIFETLLRDPDADVRGYCAANPRATRSHFELLLSDKSRRTRALAVYLGLGFPDDEQLIRLARDKSVGVRWNVIFRVGAPDKAIAIIASEDPDEINRRHAQIRVDGGSNYSQQVVESALQRRSILNTIEPFI